MREPGAAVEYRRATGQIHTFLLIAELQRAAARMLDEIALASRTPLDGWWR
jgi:hypothetical protein